MEANGCPKPGDLIFIGPLVAAELDDPDSFADVTDPPTGIKYGIKFDNGTRFNGDAKVFPWRPGKTLIVTDGR